MGCEVYAFSSSMVKEQEAKEFGATHYVSTSDKDHINKLNNSLDLLLYVFFHMTNFLELINLLRPKGKLCLLGAPKTGKLISHF